MLMFICDDKTISVLTQRVLSLRKGDEHSSWGVAQFTYLMVLSSCTFHGVAR